LIFCTSFCNKGHRVSDGKPIGHECYILPPEALEAERMGDFEKANKVLSNQKGRRVHQGVKSTFKK
jgi:hypothetical protein